MSEIINSAINSVQQSQAAWCRYITANDTGTTGAHQYGFYVPKFASGLLFDEPGHKGENKDKYKVYRVDTDIETGLGQRFGIKYLPTLLIYKDGVMIDSTIGFMSKEELLDRLNKLNI